MDILLANVKWVNGTSNIFGGGVASLFRKNNQHGRRPKIKLRPDTVIAECDILVNVDDYIQLAAPPPVNITGYTYT